MQAVYVDKYEEELKIAVEKAERILAEDEKFVPYMRFVGTTQGLETKYYYESQGKYYYESDFAKRMRIVRRQRALERMTKR